MRVTGGGVISKFCLPQLPSSWLESVDIVNMPVSPQLIHGPVKILHSANFLTKFEKLTGKFT